MGGADGRCGWAERRVPSAECRTDARSAERRASPSGEQADAKSRIAQACPEQLHKICFNQRNHTGQRAFGEAENREEA